MSLTLIAMTGILVGFLCLVIGFLMEDAKPQRVVHETRSRHGRTIRKRIVSPRRKAA